MKTNEPQAKQGGKVLKGTVVKNAAQDTVTVAVTRYVAHPKYKKFQKRTKKFLVHNPGNTAEVGEIVSIKESKPISKNKRFILVTND